MVGTILGGIGLFLLGMSLLTEGLKTVAGSALRSGLQRFTRHRISAVFTGVVATAVVQSSSATTLLCIGFVGAGLLSFTAALGVVFGANFGTTVTTWIVATVGLKLKIDVVALPLVGIGALMRLVLSGKRAGWGSALAGFGLLFVGIGLLQQGMASLSASFDLARFAGSGVGTTLALVAVGIVMTVVMQSSSAAVATTLAAVDGGAISIDQAAALVIGQNVGTTVSALIGSLGGSAGVRRTAYAHTVFNLGTGVAALALLPLFGWAIAAQTTPPDPAIAVSIFHSGFNLLGLLLFVPFIPQLARRLVAAVPEAGAELTRRLAVGRAEIPEALLEAARETTRDIARELLGQARPLLSGERTEVGEDANERLGVALARCREALEPLRTDPEVPHQYRAHLAVLHALDHLARLLEALAESARVATVQQEGTARAMSQALLPVFEQLQLWLFDDEGPCPPIERVSRELATTRREGRRALLDTAARGAITADQAEAELEAMRWVDRLGYHAWRAVHHLALALDPTEVEPAPAPESRGRRGDESHEFRQ
jgi:phosphate:Na+ symporter